MEVPEIDPNFEPQSRVRSNTWPLRPREFTKEEENRATPNSGTEGESTETPTKDPLGLSKKTSSRRNAWGNLSYADLITKAIDSSPEKRLTLSQIYDWMVQNVPYFKDKGESNSSAGWKNSIRHNLSLHSRFMRMQNEGTGKSSWWVINPDAKPGKTPRRRATSMDTKAYEKKRGRVKKKVDALRASAELHTHSNPGSEYGDSATELNLTDNFSLSPQDFRARTSSNASSIGGRLSPIQSAMESDLQEDIAPVSSPWSQAGNMNTSTYTSQDGFTETLSQSLADMFVGDLNNLSPDPNLGAAGVDQLAVRTAGLAAPSPLGQQSQVSPNPNFQEQSFLPAPPPYPEQLRSSPELSQQQQQQMSPQGLLNGGLVMACTTAPTLTTLNAGPNVALMNNPLLSSAAAGQPRCNPGTPPLQHRPQQPLPQTLSELLQDSPPPPAAQQQQQDSFISRSQDNFPGSPDSGLGTQNLQQQPQQQPQAQAANNINAQFNNSAFQSNTILQQLLNQQSQQQQHQLQQQQQSVIGLSNSLLRQALTQKAQLQLSASQEQQLHQSAAGLVGLSSLSTQPQQQQQQQINIVGGLQGLLQQQQQQHQQSSLQQQLLSGGSMLTNPPPGGIPNTGVSTTNNLPNDLLGFQDNKPSDLECDMDLIIKHELSMDGSLDFNFESLPPNSSSGQDGSASQCNTIQT